MRRLILMIALMLTVALPLTAQDATLPPVFPGAVSGDIITGGSAEGSNLVDFFVTNFRLNGYAGNISSERLGTAPAIERFCNSELDIASTSRLITAAEEQSCADRGRPATGFPVASGALLIIVSGQNDFLSDVTTVEIQQLFTNARNWSDVRPNFPDQPVNRYVPPQGSDALIAFANALFNGNATPILTSLGTRSLSADAIVQAVVNDPLAIGVVPLVAVGPGAGVEIATINGIRPDASTVSGGQYPLSFPVLLYANAQQMREQDQIAQFINFAIQNATVESVNAGLYPPTEAELQAAQNAWFDVMGTDAQPEQPDPIVTEEPVIVEPTPEPTEEEPLFEADTISILVNARADLELLAADQLGQARPEGWTGLLDVDNPQLPLLLRLDLELLVGSLLGADTRPNGWFGAVRSTDEAVARDIRHDLELLADTILGYNVRPENWAGPNDPVVRCDRATQTLVNLLVRSNLFAVTADPAAAEFCAEVEVAASRFIEANFLSGDAGAIFNAPAAAAVGGPVQIDTEFGVSFLDRFARQSAGVIPLGTPVEPVARSYVEFSNMTLVQGEGFLVFVDYQDTTLTVDQFEVLPNVDSVSQQPFCNARFCR